MITTLAIRRLDEQGLEPAAIAAKLQVSYQTVERALRTQPGRPGVTLADVVERLERLEAKIAAIMEPQPSPPAPAEEEAPEPAPAVPARAEKRTWGFAAPKKGTHTAADQALIEEFLRTKGATQCPTRFAEASQAGQLPRGDR